MQKAIYNKYSEFLKEKFKEKVYKLPISLNLTCPNRDGTKGRGGCIYCSEEGGSFENLPNDLSIKTQLEKNKIYIGKKYNAKKFIAYFQSFTNTYLPIEDFKKNFEAATSVEGIIGVSISTRPDTIGDEFIEYLKTKNEEYFITVELGLQSVNDKTLKIINRGHDLSDFIDAVLRLKKNNLRVCAHLILNLPWDDSDDIIKAADILSALKVDEVKLHSLYITDKTKLGEMYKKGELKLKTEAEYIIAASNFLSHLDENIVVQRLLGRNPEENSLFSNWGKSWWKIQDEILSYMTENNLYQGKLCKFK